VICVPLLGRDPARRDRPIRTGRRDRPIIQLPSIALRVAVIVGIAAVMFGIVFFRLWFLQILSGQEFVAQANDNRLSSVKVVAQRGYIVDRKGEVIVGNRPGEAAGIRLMDVPEGMLDDELERLARVLRMRPGELRKRIKDYLYPSTLEQNEDGTWSSFFTWQLVADKDLTGLDLIVLKHDVSRKVVTYLKERTLQFPGVEIQDESLRSYPQGDMAAQVLGHLGEISADQLETQHFKGYDSGDVVGYDGLEYTYDKWLRGRDGVARIEVDAHGRPKQTDPVGGRMPDAGDTLVTTIDSKVQAASEQALRTGISLAHSDGQYAANGGAAVVMDVKNGDILGMASYPTYDPDLWVGGISAKDYKKLTRKSANNPMLIRPIMEAKAVGSTFKAVTSIAALEEGVITPGTTEWCPGSYSSPNDLADPPQEFKCWAHDGHGNLDLIGAITQSCDVYFYNVGNAFYNRQGSALSDWAGRLGMGDTTGIDIPGESEGRVPTPAWKKQHYETEIDKLWKPGDSILLSVGQGDLEATPLQLATSYAAVANGGTVVTPHLGLKVVDAAGETIRDLEPTTSRKVDMSQTNLDVVRRGLYDAAHSPAGTSAPIFFDYKVAVAGKTGTAEVWDDTSKHYVDYAWYASYAPADNPKYVVVVMIEKGGHGASTAAPATRMIYDALFNLDSGEFSGSVSGD
jgi:penicillin-binding protein 2